MAGRREKNKEERRQRIRRATFDVLLEKGFHKATVGEIAERAGVGKGTLFLYAKDKVDLSLLCINDDVDAITDQAFNNIRFELPLLDQILEFFRPRFEFWGQFPDLARAATREMSTAYSPAETSRELARGIARRAHTKAKLTEILRVYCEQKRPTKTFETEWLSQVILDVYLTELRFWLSADEPRVENAIETLRYLIAPIVQPFTKKQNNLKGPLRLARPKN